MCINKESRSQNSIVTFLRIIFFCVFKCYVSEIIQVVIVEFCRSMSFTISHLQKENIIKP